MSALLRRPLPEVFLTRSTARSGSSSICASSFVFDRRYTLLRVVFTHRHYRASGFAGREGPRVLPPDQPAGAIHAQVHPNRCSTRQRKRASHSVGLRRLLPGCRPSGKAPRTAFNDTRLSCSVSAPARRSATRYSILRIANLLVAKDAGWRREISSSPICT